MFWMLLAAAPEPAAPTVYLHVEVIEVVQVEGGGGLGFSGVGCRSGRYFARTDAGLVERESHIWCLVAVPAFGGFDDPRRDAALAKRGHLLASVGCEAEVQMQSSPIQGRSEAQVERRMGKADRQAQRAVAELQAHETGCGQHLGEQLEGISYTGGRRSVTREDGLTIYAQARVREQEEGAVRAAVDAFYEQDLIPPATTP